MATMTSLGLLSACKPKQITVESPTTETTELTEESQPGRYIAFCGTSYCLQCPEYKRTCAGCLAAEGEIVSDSAAKCAVRECNLKRNLTNCAHCEEYPCQKLEDLYAKYGGMAGARATLEEIHKSLP